MTMNNYNNRALNNANFNKCFLNDFKIFGAEFIEQIKTNKKVSNKVIGILPQWDFILDRMVVAVELVNCRMSDEFITTLCQALTDALYIKTNELSNQMIVVAHNIVNFNSTDLRLHIICADATMIPPEGEADRVMKYNESLSDLHFIHNGPKDETLYTPSPIAIHTQWAEGITY